MFGYVTPYKQELRLREYNLFRAYYCGLCKTLGRDYNNVVRMGLNFDLSFLSLLLSSIEKERDEVSYEHCIMHPIRKRMIVDRNESLRYAADISVMLIYFKLIDDWRDDKSLKALLANIPFKMSIEKAREREPDKFKFLREKLDELTFLEKSRCREVDKVAAVFGIIMEEVAVPDFVEDENTRRVLKFLGYNLGRWIYVLDAFDDLREDIESRQYNPLLLEYNYSCERDIDLFLRDVRDEISLSLTFTLENISKSLELLDIANNREILENIVYLGMRQKMEQVFEKGGM